MKTVSSFLTLNVTDFVKGLLMAILGAMAAIIMATIDAGSLTFDWAAIGKAALLAGAAYLTKNFLTNNKGSFLAKDIPAA
jgi:hypothetical protein